MTVLLFPILLALLVLAAYADRVYQERGKFLARASQDNVDAWELLEPRFGFTRETLELSAAMLHQITLAALALLAGVSLLPLRAWYQPLLALFELAIIIIFFDRAAPSLLFARTTGAWAARFVWLYRALFYAVSPFTLLLGLVTSITALTRQDDAADEEHPDEGVDALLEAGEEEGILEDSDRELVRGAVEFGDKVVREVMTPRPEMFAVPDSMTLAELTAELNARPHSRVPVYSGRLDNITGLVFAHDLLQVDDSEAGQLTVASMQRPAAFVPEPKRVNELLREMQREKQHMRIVIDEYGAVAGLVTIEDLLEAIVGEIEDEHEAPDPASEVQSRPDGSYIVPGSLDVDELRDLFNTEGVQEGEEPVRFPAHLESTTVGGLVSEVAGHIPLPGEVVELAGLRLEVLSSTSRVVTRVHAALAS